MSDRMLLVCLKKNKSHQQELFNWITAVYDSSRVLEK